MVVAHLTAGILLTVVLAGRIGWRLAGGRRIKASGSALGIIFARTVEYTLYTLLIAEAGLGFAWRWGAGQPMSFFGLLTQPPFMAFPHETVTLIKQLHYWNAWLIVGLSIGHAGAALFHRFVLCDAVLDRMLLVSQPDT